MADYIDCSTVDTPTSPIIPPKDPPGGGLPSGGEPGQVLTIDDDGDPIWAPGGGGGIILYNTTGQSTTGGMTQKAITDALAEGGGKLQQAITATKTVGGVTAGQTIAAGTTYDDIFRLILAPALTPTLTPPSATLSTSTPTPQESGGSVTATFNTTFNRGSINPAYGTSGYRSGAATGYSMNGGASQSSPSFSQTITASGNYRVTVEYAAGEQPKDSTGANYSTPLAAGSVQSNTISFEFVDALWGTTVSTTTVTKQPLVSKSAGTYTFALADQTSATPMYFDIPASWQITEVAIYNPITRDWEEKAREFNVSDTTHEDAGGNTVSYKRYTDNRGYGAAGREVRIKWRV